MKLPSRGVSNIFDSDARTHQLEPRTFLLFPRLVRESTSSLVLSYFAWPMRYSGGEGGWKILKFEIMRGRARADPNSNALANSIFDRRRTSLFFSVFIFERRIKSIRDKFRVSRKKRG